MSEQPMAPSEVRVARLDGSSIPLECVYEYTDEDGMHHWRAVATVRFQKGDRIEMGVLPARTRIHVQMAS